MRIAVRLARPMMSVIFLKWSEALQQFIDVAYEALFGIVDVDTRSDVHGRNQNHALHDPAFRQGCLDLWGDVYVFAMILRAKRQIFGVKPHTGDHKPRRPITGRLDTCRADTSDLMTMRRRAYVELAIFACTVLLVAQAAFAQTQAQPPVSSGNASAGNAQDQQPEPGQLPPSPVEEREKQIRQFDPLDRTEQDSRDKTNAPRGAEKGQSQDQAPLPGSIAASEQNSARRSGPEVVDDENGEAPVQEYSGPAVLSRSYSISQPLIPQQLKWQESVGVSGVYDSGVVRTVNADGSLGAASTLMGVLVNWGLTGRHYFRRDMVSVSYTGNISEYSGSGAYSGLNQNMGVAYSHVLSRRLTLNVSGSGSILSQNSVLENQPTGPDTIANINIASSPNIQIFDVGAKQFTSQADLTWKLTSRLSFSMGTSYFGIERDSALLLGVTGQQARGDVNYRWTRKMTVGAYYSFNHYLYPHGFGNSATNTFGLIYSYAFNRTTQLRFRGGLSSVQSLGLETVPINPAIAALLGESTGVVDSYLTYRTTDFSVQFIKDFRGGKRTASIAYARGISPGNGVFQTSQQESISANLTTRLFRNYSLAIQAGRDTLVSVTLSAIENLGKYQSDYGRISLSRTYRRGVGLSLAAEYRYFDVDVLGYLRSQVRITSGFTWGSGTGRLWPF